jgi:hypothetical protein
VRTALVLLAFSASTALAHTAPSGWQYPPNCCEKQHCQPAPCDEMLEAEDGGIEYQTPEGFRVYVAKPHVKPSPDAQCHICYNHSGTIQQGVANGYCAWIQYGH